MFFWKNKKKGFNFLVAIGSGQNQLPLIHEAKKLGFHIIGVDINSTAPGFLECDLKIQESIENHEDIYLRLTELILDGKIKGIMTKSFGMAIRTVSYLNAFFKIPYMPVKSSECFLEKKKMKSIIKNAGIQTPDIIKISSKSGKIANSLLPVIIKPETGHAKNGVALISTQDEYRKYISGNSGINLIAEKYVKGDEIIAAGITHNKKFYLIEITDKFTTSLPFFVDITHISPSKHIDKWEQIQKIGQKVSDAFEIINSPIIIEFIIDENNEINLIEAVPEFGGEFIPEIMIKHSAGYNIFAESIKSITAEGFTPPVFKKRKKFIVIKYITGTEGRLVSLNPEAPKRIKQLLFSRIFKNIGDEIRIPENNHDRIGVVAVSAKTYIEAMAAADEAVNSYDIQIRPK